MAKKASKIRAKAVRKVKAARSNKIKTKKGAAKRYKVLGSGKVKATHANANHFTGKKTSKRMIRRRGGFVLGKWSRNLVFRCMPSSF